MINEVIIGSGSHEVNVDFIVYYVTLLNNERVCLHLDSERKCSCAVE